MSTINVSCHACTQIGLTEGDRLRDGESSQHSFPFLHAHLHTADGKTMTDTCPGKKGPFMIYIKMPNRLECPDRLLLDVTYWTLLPCYTS